MDVFSEGTCLVQTEDLDILRGLGNELGVWGAAGMQFRAPNPPVQQLLFPIGARGNKME